MSTILGSHALAASFSIGEEKACVAQKKKICSLKLQLRSLELEVVRPLIRRSKLRDQFKIIPSRTVSVASASDPQNVDLPRTLPKRKKRPSIYPPQKKKKVTLVHPDDGPVGAPANGLLVEEFIPVAREVMKAKATLNTGVHRLLEELPVFACRFCSEIHVGSRGHNVRTCQGMGSAARNSHHEWVKGNANDVLVPVEAYHISDRLALPIRHEERFDIARVSAIEELCIQAGVDVSEYPIKRYDAPVEPSTKGARAAARWSSPGQITYYTALGSYQLDPSNGRKQQYPDVTIGLARGRTSHEEESEFSEPERIGGGSEEIRSSGEQSTLGEESTMEVNAGDDLQTVAQKTLQAWESMRDGAQKLMTKYRVLACGYCPEIHVGPRGHRARVCGAFKHQWRDGKHGWQDASIDELIPPQYVWHVRDQSRPPLHNALRSFYGKAPAVVELCIHAGAPIPEKYKAVMRLDVTIPALDEARDVV